MGRQRKTKLAKVRSHLQRGGSITSLQAINKYGATRLAAIIYTLRHEYKMNIVTISVPLQDNHGVYGEYAKYKLVK